MRRLLYVIALLFAATCAIAQNGNTVMIIFAGAPTGTCPPIALAKNQATGELYDCLNGAWNLISGGGGSISGSGTANTITKWSAASVLTNANPTDDGTTFALTELFTNTITDTTLTAIEGSQFTLTLNPASIKAGASDVVFISQTSAPTQSITGRIRGLRINNSPSGSAALTRVEAGNFSAVGTNTATGTNIAIFADAEMQNSSGTTATNEAHLIQSGQATAGGTITQDFGINLVAPNKTGVMTHHYGINCASGHTGGANNADGWCFFVTSATDQSQFGIVNMLGAFNTPAQIISTLATGTAPFVVASTTNVANLNASSLSGATFAAPGAIGGGTPSTGAFTTISASGTVTLGTNGGTQGTLTLNGSTSGSASWQAGTTAATLTTAAAISTAAITSSNTVTAGAGNNFTFNGRTKFGSSADGLLLISNNGATDFTRMMLGGTTSSFPAIKRNATALNFRLADDSADAPVTMGSTTIGGGTPILKVLSATATLDFANQAAIGCNDLTITVTGAAVGDTTDLGVPNGSVVNGTAYFTAWVSSANTVTVRYCNLVSGDPASGTFRATVSQF